MRVFVAGDIHGVTAGVLNIVRQINNPTAEDIVIIAGDAGLEYGNMVMGSVKKEMKKFPGTWIIMRGNHDNCYWNNHTDYINGEYVPHKGWTITNDLFLIQEKYPNIKYVRDWGGIHTLGEKTFLFIPGAYSVDKFYRLANHYPYNPKEQLTDEEFKNLLWIADNNRYKIDYVISHTAPWSFEPHIRDLFMNNVSQFDIDKTTEKWLDEFYIVLDDNYDKWFFGHYHDDRTVLGKHEMLYHTITEVTNEKERA